jgi:Rhodopirellula transposase DDE domain
MIRSTRGRSVSGAERRWLKVFRTLNEFQARLFAADKALDLGRGGMSRLSALTGLSRTTITNAVEELEKGGKLVSPGEGRVRRVGGGRKKVEGVDPGVRHLLAKLLEETTAGDPMSQLRWTSKSTRTMAEELTRLGHPVSWVTAARCLDDMGYSLRANRKSKEGRQHADRDAQFRYINRQVKALLGTGDPVISVDAKKKELVGPFKKWRSQVAAEREAAGGEHQGFPQLGPRQGAFLWGLRHRAESGSGQCGGYPRHSRVCRRKHPAMVETGRAKELSGGGAITNLCRCWGKQRKSTSCLEAPLAAAYR